MDFAKIEIRLNGDIVNPKIISFELKQYEKSTENITFNSREDMISAIQRVGIKLQYGTGDFPVSYSLPDDIGLNNDSLKFLTTIKRSEWFA
jgi:hypothetical protein